jgi:hypothetical protein
MVTLCRSNARRFTSVPDRRFPSYPIDPRTRMTRACRATSSPNLGSGCHRNYRLNDLLLHVLSDCLTDRARHHCPTHTRERQQGNQTKSGSTQPAW